MRFSANPSPTPYAALNTVLASFVERVRDLTADNFVGAYLQGSFALGDFDENSDADFLIVVKRDIADSDVPALNALHTAIHDFPPPWGHRLEGSYSPAAILRRWSENPRDPPGAPPRPRLGLIRELAAAPRVSIRSCSSIMVRGQWCARSTTIRRWLAG
jgi:Nucleotidyltransferase domain